MRKNFIYFLLLAIFALTGASAFSANLCERILRESPQLVGGYDSYWQIREDGSLQINSTTNTVFSELAPLEAPRKGIRFTDKRVYPFSNRQTEIETDSESRVVFIRTYLSNKPVAESLQLNDVLKNEFQYRFALSENPEKCHPISARAMDSNWISWLRPMLDMDACAAILGPYKAVKPTVANLNAEDLSNPRLAYDRDQLLELAKVMDAYNIAPTYSWGEKTNAASVDRMWSLGEGVTVPTVVYQSQKLLKKCREFSR